MVETRGEPRTDAQPALWETDVEHPSGGVWRVRTVDLQREPLQMPPEMIKVVIGNMGRFMTTIYGSDGGQYRMTYSPSRGEAEEFHDRSVERVRNGRM